MAEHDSFDESQLGFRLPETRASSARFDFLAWSTATHFAYPERAASLLQRVESAAEAWLVRDLLAIPGAIYDGGSVVFFRGAAVRVQVPAGKYRVDIVVEFEQTRLAVEVDGLEHHGMTQAQFTWDHFRARQLMIGGYVVVRFTANEAMTRPRSCWRDTFAILKTRTSIERLA